MYILKFSPGAGHAGSATTDEIANAKIYESSIIFSHNPTNNAAPPWLQQLVANVASVVTKLDTIKQDVSSLTTKVDATNRDMASVIAKVDAMKEDVTSVTNKVDTMQADVTTAITEVKATAATVKLIEADVAYLRARAENTRRVLKNQKVRPENGYYPLLKWVSNLTAFL